MSLLSLVDNSTCKCFQGRTLQDVHKQAPPERCQLDYSPGQKSPPPTLNAGEIYLLVLIFFMGLRASSPLGG
jgi:hypothetical protein